MAEPKRQRPRRSASSSPRIDWFGTVLAALVLVFIAICLVKLCTIWF